MWDPSADPAAQGYFLYVGTQSGVYAYRYDVGLSTSFVFSNAVAGKLYYFAASSYDSSYVEGYRSPEISGYSDAPPMLTNPGNQTSPLGQAVTLQLVGSDPYGQPVSYKATGLPAGLTLTQSTGLITGTPAANGTSSVSASVTDGLLSDTKTFSWTIGSTSNLPPTLTDPGSQTSLVGQSVTLQLIGKDPEGKPVSYSATGLPAGLTLNATTGLIAGVSQLSGTSTVTAKASDGALSDSKTFSWTIGSASSNLPPSLTDPGVQSGTVGKSASLQLIAKDPEGKSLSYSATGLPAGLTLNATTGLITGIPKVSAFYTVAAKVSDGALTDSKTFLWSVGSDITPPVLSITSPSTTTVTVKTKSIAMSGTATDNIGVASVSWSNSRGGSGLATGTSQWKATVPLQKGTNLITITVKDQAGIAVSRQITVTFQ